MVYPDASEGHTTRLYVPVWSYEDAGVPHLGERGQLVHARASACGDVDDLPAAAGEQVGQHLGAAAQAGQVYTGYQTVGGD